MIEEDDKVSGRINGDQPEVQKDGPFVRLLYMILIWFMISLAHTVLGVTTVVQFVIGLVNNGTPNERLAEFGTDLGVWMAKAARFLTYASEVKPWPWTELD